MIFVSSAANRRLYGSYKNESESSGTERTMDIQLINQLLNPPTNGRSQTSLPRSTSATPSEQSRQQRAQATIREYGELLRDNGWLARRCETCDDQENIVIDGVAQPCPDCAHLRRAERLQTASGLNPAERLIRLDDVLITGGGTDEAVLAARKFLINPTRILTLWGGSGNAKTLILQAVVNECLERSVSAVYTTLYDLAGYVREAFRNDSESAWQRVRRFQSVNVLCIDEFDKVKMTEWIEELETAIINRRYRDGLAGLCGTLIAMNESPSELPPWISSRLHDGRNRIVHNGDGDLRPLLSDSRRIADARMLALEEAQR